MQSDLPPFSCTHPQERRAVPFSKRDAQLAQSDEMHIAFLELVDSLSHSHLSHLLANADPRDLSGSVTCR